MVDLKPKDILQILAGTFNYYRRKFVDDNSPSKRELIVRKGDIAVAQFSPDFPTIKGNLEGIKLDFLFQCTAPTQKKDSFLRSMV